MAGERLLVNHPKVMAWKQLAHFQMGHQTRGGLQVLRTWGVSDLKNREAR